MEAKIVKYFNFVVSPRAYVLMFIIDCGLRPLLSYFIAIGGPFNCYIVFNKIHSRKMLIYFKIHLLLLQVHLFSVKRISSTYN